MIGHGGLIQLAAFDQVEVRAYLGKQYICLMLQRTGKDGRVYVNRMNFDEEKWNILVKAGMRIMQPPKPTKKSRKRKVNSQTEDCKKRLFPDTITLYNWVYEGVLSPSWYLTEELCKQAFVFVDNEDDVQIQTREGPAPTTFELGKMITTYFVIGEIRRHMRDQCYGCQVDHPSQIQHLEGCMRDWVMASQLFYDESFSTVTLDKLNPALKQITDVLKMSVEEVDQVPCIRTEVEDMILDSEFEFLFRVILV